MGVLKPTLVSIHPKERGTVMQVHTVAMVGKSAGSDKKLFKQLENKYSPAVDLTVGSISPDDLQVISPFGRLDEVAPRRTFFYLLATLNAAYPDNDFSEVRPDQFSKQHSLDLVINSVNTTLFNLGNDFIVNQYR